MNGKYIVIAVLALALIGATAYLVLNQSEDIVVDNPDTPNTEEPMPVEPDEGIGDGAEPLEPEPAETEDPRGDESVIGTSVEGTDIAAYHFGSGDTEVLLVGGVHGGYSPNTADLGEAFVNYFEENPGAVPAGVMVTVVPVLNPDGLDETGAAGRFNANDVDLNRNFDCEWSSQATWREQTVSGGDEPFSEPEARALREYVLTYEPESAVVWFSQEGKVYPAACEGTPNNASVELAATFATAAGYPAEAQFNAYTITGDMVNWMAKEGVTGISVLLSDHQSTEWEKNRAGVDAILNAYAQ